MDNHVYTKKELIKILNNCINKTLEEVDSLYVFEEAEKYEKITGIAGDVLEQSVLGYEKNSSQEADLEVDGIPTELKVTGIRKSKKEIGKFEAKEPMTITAVSPEKIVHEYFENSSFWHKLEHMLIVYYLYNSDKTVKAIDYKNFKIMGYDFHEFDDFDREILKFDWNTVKNFIKYLQDNYDDYEKQYPRISSELRDKLLYIDTAPKWPNRPRFRLKRSVVTAMVEELFGEKYEELPDNYNSYDELVKKCAELSKKYKGYSVKELIDIFKLEKSTNKSIGERIIVRMFGGHSESINKIKLFNRIGLSAKTIVLNQNGGRTEDMKLFSINFDEIQDIKLNFEESSFFEYFYNKKMLCIVFKEPYKESALEENVFEGFKLLSFSDIFIKENVEKCWNEIRDLVNNKKLVDVIKKDKNGNAVYNKTGQISSAPNFPKSSNNIIFVRGGGTDSNSKPECVNNIRMYKQYIWIKGKDIVNELQKVSYIK